MKTSDSAYILTMLCFIAANTDKNETISLIWAAMGLVWAIVGALRKYLESK